MAAFRQISALLLSSQIANKISGFCPRSVSPPPLPPTLSLWIYNAVKSYDVITVLGCKASQQDGVVINGARLSVLLVPKANSIRSALSAAFIQTYQTSCVLQGPLKVIAVFTFGTSRRALKQYQYRTDTSILCWWEQISKRKHRTPPPILSKLDSRLT